MQNMWRENLSEGPSPESIKAARLRRLIQSHEKLKVVTLEDEVDRVIEIEVEPIPLGEDHGYDD